MEFESFLNSELVFKESSSFCGAHHCVFIRNFRVLKRPQLIFHGAPRFCHPPSFSIDSNCFLVTNSVFQ